MAIEVQIIVLLLSLESNVAILTTTSSAENQDSEVRCQEHQNTFLLWWFENYHTQRCRF